jgi:UDP-glucuronate decarboxylase
LGNPDEFTVRQLATMVAEATGTKVNVDTRSLPQDDPTRRRPDISLAGRMLGWSPNVPLKEGIARTVEWFRSIDLGEYTPPSPNVLQPEAQRESA